jgi:hypothetical protein
VLPTDALKVGTQGTGQSVGQHRHAVLSSLAVSYRDLPACEVDVLDSEPATLQEAQPGTVEERRHQPRDSPHPRQDRLDLLKGQDQRQANGPLRPDHAVETGDLTTQDLAVQEQQGTERLVLRGRADPPPGGETGEELRDLGGAHGSGVPLPGEASVAPDPHEVRLLRARAVVAGTDRLSHPLDSASGGRDRGLGDGGCAYLPAGVGRTLGHLSPFSAAAACPSAGESRGMAGSRRYRRLL